MTLRPPWIVAGGILAGGLLLGYFAADTASRRQRGAAEEAARRPAAVCAGNLERLIAQQAGAAATLAAAVSWGGVSGFEAATATLDGELDPQALLLGSAGEVLHSAGGHWPLRLPLGADIEGGSAKFGTVDLEDRSLAVSLAPASGGAAWAGTAVALPRLLQAAECLGAADPSPLQVVLPDLERGGLRPLAQAPVEAGLQLLRIPVRSTGRDAMVVAAVRRSGTEWQLAAVAAVLTLVLAIGGYWWAGSAGRRAAELDAHRVELATADRRWMEEAGRRAALEETIERQRDRDPLTRLSTREDLLRRLSRALGRVRLGSDRAIAVLFLGIDRFKNVNESLGQLAGDRVLAEVGRRLGRTVRPGDETARIGGDRFAALLYGVDGPALALAVAERLHQAIRTPIDIDGHEIFISASLGLVMAEEGLEPADELLTRAEMAMHQAKEGGSGQSAVFHPAMEVRAGSRLQLESDLRRAISAEQFELHFQPIVSLERGTIEGMESLLRWMHPADGLVAPDRFIALAEQTGLIVPLTRWVLARAVETLRQWQQQEPATAGLYLSVNLSGRDLDDPALCDYVRGLLRDSGLAPGSLRVELTEGAVLRDFETAARRLGELHDMEVPILLDDFGTGYSSLSYLHQLPFDFVKIDRSFVRRMAGPRGDTRMVRTIVDLARHMDIGSVAEGVETPRDAELLREVGCEYGQGYLYSWALPEADARRFVVARQGQTGRSA